MERLKVTGEAAADRSRRSYSMLFRSALSDGEAILHNATVLMPRRSVSGRSISRRSILRGRWEGRSSHLEDK